MRGNRRTLLNSRLVPPRFQWISAAAALVLCLSAFLPAQDSKYPPQGDQFPGPPSKADTADWLQEIRQYREERRIRAGLNGEIYARPELQWAQSSFMQPQSMVEDRFFYDPIARRYTVDRFLADLDRRRGGIDSILLWPVYPNIGIDNRNQFDLLRDMPGGIAGLREMVADFHRRGVRVLFPRMPWDMNTNAPGLSVCSGIPGDIRSGSNRLVVLFHQLVPGSLPNVVKRN